MKQVFVCLLVSSVACALFSATASAQLGASSSPCASATIQVESARYVGRSAGKDSVEVRWRVLGAAGPSQLQGGLGGGGFGGGGGGGVSAEVVCFTAMASTIQGSFTVNVKIRRRLGDQDSASTTVSGRLSDSLSTVVRIERGALETDPQSFEVSVTSSAVTGGNGSFTSSFKGLGAPSMATTRTETTNPLSISSICLPSLSLSQVTFTPGSGTVKDKVTFAWTTTPAQTACLLLRNPSASATVARTNGSPGGGSALLAVGATSATIELSGTSAPVSSFELRFSAKLASPFLLIGRGDLQGNF